MENVYAVGLKNRYELFYDEDIDPFEILQKHEMEKSKVDKTQSKDKSMAIKSGKPVSSTEIPKKTKESPPVISARQPEKTEPTYKPRGKPFADRSSRNVGNVEDYKEPEERKVFRNREDKFNPDFRDREEFKRGRGAYRGRGRGIGGRGGGGGFISNYESNKRREFDRHSGSAKTGVRHFDKRDGAGSNNWGDIKGDINIQKETETSWMDEDLNASGDKPNEPPAKVEEASQENQENEPVVEEPAEEIVKEMTLDEWKREQEALRAIPKYNIRKPEKDDAQWKKLYVLKKKAKEDEEEEEEDDGDDEYARRGRQRQLIDIPINFNDSRRSRGRGGRGGRGGMRSRGGGGNFGGDRNHEAAPNEDHTSREVPAGTGVRPMNRGTGRSNKSNQQSAPRVDNWNDFPSLVQLNIAPAKN